MKPYSLSQLDDELRRLIPDFDVVHSSAEAALHVDGGANPPHLPDGVSEDDVRRYLLAPHYRGTHSEVCHRAVWMLHDLGFCNDEIAEILKDMPWLPKRYRNRLSTEIKRSLSKPRPVCCATISSAVPLPLNKQCAITLASCPQLSDAFMRTLERYGNYAGLPVSNKILDTSRVIESVSKTDTQLSVQFPCGVGKSTWAVVHIATSAGQGELYIMVVQNRETVFHAANQLRAIMPPDDVGVYVGWNSEECVSISGKPHDFKDCLRDDNQSACRTCDGRDKCNYHRSRSQLGRNVVVMTRESFLVLCEKGCDFSRRRIICDEALLTFVDEAFSADELDTLHRLFTRYGYDNRLSNLLKSLFPSLSFNAFSGAGRIPDGHIHWCELSKVWDGEIVSRIIRFVKAAGDSLLQSEALVYRFLLYFRTAAMCGASYAYTYDGKILRVKKDRLDLRNFTACRSMMVLDATAALSLSEFAPTTCIYTCPDLDIYAKQGFAKFYVAVGNPTKTRRVKNIEAGLELMQVHGSEIFAAGPVMLPLNRDCDDAIAHVETGITQCASRHGLSVQIRKISRGLMRGTNAMRDCTSAFMAAAGFFTSIEDIALHACLRQRRDLPWSELRNADGSPRMHHGRFTNSVAQDIYMRKAITELYQGIYRSAIRDGRNVSVVLAVPDAGWLLPLWQLMRFTVVDAAHANPQTVQMFTGLSRLVNMSAGATVTKRDAAACLGYPGVDGWKDHKDMLNGLLAQFFQINHHGLVRKELS